MNKSEIEQIAQSLTVRAKRIDNGEWIEGFYIGEIDNAHRIRYETRYGYRNYNVDPNTICRYFCALPNGDKVWENDVRGKEYPKLVKYIDNVGFRIANISDLKGQNWVNIWQAPNQYWFDNLAPELLGNSIDNPELLKEKENE